MKPFFPYFGSKCSLGRKYRAVAAELGNWAGSPVVVEPFAGSAGYSVAVEPKVAILADADPTIAGLWQYLIGVSEERILRLPTTEPGETLNDPKYDGLLEPERALIGFWINRASSVPKKAVPQDPTWGSFTEGTKRRIAGQLHKIRKWRALCVRYEFLLPILADVVRAPPGQGDQYPAEIEFFVDPPYAGNGKHYRYGVAASEKTGHRGVDFDHLAGWVACLPGRTVVCEQDGNEGQEWFEVLAGSIESAGRKHRHARLSARGARTPELGSLLDRGYGERALIMAQPAGEPFWGPGRLEQVDLFP